MEGQDLSSGMPEFWNVMYSPEVLLGEVKYRHEWWQGDEGVAWVCFDKRDRVVTKEFTRGRPVKRSFFQRLRRWLGL